MRSRERDQHVFETESGALVLSAGVGRMTIGKRGTNRVLVR
jgi:hypothetical protein